MIGVYHLPLEYIAVDTGLFLNDVTDIIAKLQEVNFCQYDAEHEYVWIIDFAAKQTGLNLRSSDKRVIAVHKLLNNLPQLHFIKDFFEKYQSDYHLLTLSHEIERHGQECGQTSLSLPRVTRNAF